MSARVAAEFTASPPAGTLARQVVPRQEQQPGRRGVRPHVMKARRTWAGRCPAVALRVRLPRIPKPLAPQLPPVTTVGRTRGPLRGRRRTARAAVLLLRPVLTTPAPRPVAPTRPPRSGTAFPSTCTPTQRTRTCPTAP